jgi:aminodeoxyfutalosine deaminase
LSIHLGESSAELEFLRTGGGPWRTLLDALGAWDPAWEAPRCGAVEYVQRLGLLGSRLLAVHCVQLTDAELSMLAAAGATVVTCPRSNQWTGAGVPPIQSFYDSGARVAIGTDSLASVESLSMFDEMAAVRRVAPEVPARRILRSATCDGAAALGFDDFGSIEPGKRARLLSVRVPHDVGDVEEYLVSGVAASAVHWL